MNELNDVLNIGVPCYNSLELDLFSLTFSCAKNIQESIEAERLLISETRNKIEHAINHQSLNYKTNFLKYINLFCNESSKSNFGLDRKQVLINMFSSLGTLNRKDSINDIKKIIIERKRELENFSIYINSNPYSKEFNKDIRTTFNYLYKNKPFNIDLRKYLINEIEHYNQLIKYFNTNPNIIIDELMEYYLYCLDPDKVIIFIAYNSILMSQEAIKYNNYNIAQKYLFFVTAYLELYKNIGVKISFKDKKYKIDYNEILNMYNNLLNKNDKLKNIYLDRQFFINKNTTNNENVICNLDRFNYILKDLIENNIIIEDKEDIYKEISRKLYFYLDNNPMNIIKYKNINNSSFNNYLAFVYPNGMILLDRFLNLYDKKDLKDDALYVFNAYDFEKNIHFKKIQVKDNKIIHGLNWETKAKNIIRLDTSDNLKESARILCKKYSQKN